MSLETWQKWINVYIGIPVVIIGLVGNVLSLIIWNRARKKKLFGNVSTTLFLLALGVCDICLITFYMLVESLGSLNPEIKENYTYARFYAWFGYPMLYVSLTASIWMIIVILINRLSMIFFPIKARQWFNVNRTFIGIVGVAAFALVINFPNFLIYEAKTSGNNGTTELEKTAFGDSEVASAYEFWAHCMFITLLPILFTVCASWKMIQKLNERSQEKSKGDTGTKKTGRNERQAMKMIVVVGLSFVIFLLIQCGTQCFWMLGLGGSEKRIHHLESTRGRVHVAFMVGKFSMVFNSATNWILYCFSSSVFRKEMKETLHLNQNKDNKFENSCRMRSRKNSKIKIMGS